ncbi:MAG: right-handed parallel beta-helix repeat-containing protein, partial [Planctomycetota bacterium]
MRVLLRGGMGLGIFAAFCLVGSGWAGCTKRDETGQPPVQALNPGETPPDAGKAPSTPKPPETPPVSGLDPAGRPTGWAAPPGSEPAKIPETPKPPEPAKTGPTGTPAEPPPVTTVSLASMSRDEAKAAFKARFAKVFGGGSGIQSPMGVKKLNDAWEKSMEPLLGAKLADYKQKYATASPEPAGEGDTGGKKKKKKRPSKKGVDPAIRTTVEEKFLAVFDPAWGIADKDLPKLNAALSVAFRAAKNQALEGEDPADVGRPRPPEGPVGPSDPSLDRGAPDGFGAKATGGGDAQVKRAHANATSIAAALQGGGNVQIAKGDVDCDYGELTIGSNTTVDGGGATLWYPGKDHNGRGLQMFGQNIVLRNIRVRNSGDGLSMGGMTYRKTANVLIENASATGNGDDGFSPSYDCKDITFRWSFLAGNARCIFFKYGGTNLTVHHSVLTHYWIRGPLVNGGSIDFRNNLVQNWSMWGSRVEGGGKGNFVGNVWRKGSSGGKADSALYTGDGGGTIYQAGNVFEGCSPRVSEGGSPAF